MTYVSVRPREEKHPRCIQTSVHQLHHVHASESLIALNVLIGKRSFTTDRLVSNGLWSDLSSFVSEECSRESLTSRKKDHVAITCLLFISLIGFFNALKTAHLKVKQKTFKVLEKTGIETDSEFEDLVG